MSKGPRGIPESQLCLGLRRLGHQRLLDYLKVDVTKVVDEKFSQRCCCGRQFKRLHTSVNLFTVLSSLDRIQALQAAHARAVSNLRG